MAEQYSVQFDSSEIDEISSGTNLAEIVESNVAFCRSYCVVPECGIKATVERDPITDLGKPEGIDVVTVSCDDDTCGKEFLIPKEPAISKVRMAGMMTIVKVQRELAKRRGLI